jgi:ribosome-associated protein
MSSGRLTERSGRGNGGLVAKEPSEAVVVPLRELEIRFVRSSGPGGQNVNKVSTKAVLRWRPAESRALPAAVRARFGERYARRLTKEGEVVLTSDRFRDQGRNAADCVGKLQAMVDRVAEEPRVRRKTRPTRAARERRLETKRRRAETKLGRSAPRREDS